MHGAASERLFVVALDARGGGGRVPGLLVGGVLVVGVVARRDTDRMTDDAAAFLDATMPTATEAAALLDASALTEDEALAMLAAAFDAEATEGYAEATVRPR